MEYQGPDWCAFVDKTSVGQGLVETKIRRTRDRAEDDLEVLKRVEAFPIKLMTRCCPGGKWIEASALDGKAAS